MRILALTLLPALLSALAACTGTTTTSPKDAEPNAQDLLSRDASGFLSKEALAQSVASQGASKATDAADGYDPVAEGRSLQAFTIDPAAPKIDALANADQAKSLGSGSDIDLRSFDSPVRDQGSEGLCTAFATAGAMENLLKQSGSEKDLSERHLWSLYEVYNTEDSLQAATSAFIVDESTWPYDSSRTDSTASGVAKLTTYDSLSSGDGIVRALQARHPVVIALNTTSPFFNRRTGVVYSDTPESGYGHAMVVSGVLFDSRFSGGGVLVIKNSWGPDVADRGYIYMPFGYCAQHGCWFWEVSAVERKDGVEPGPGPGPGPDPAPIDPTLGSCEKRRTNSGELLSCKDNVTAAQCPMSVAPSYVNNFVPGGKCGS